jgi:predicted alpha-1,2-mannosidase
MAERGKVRKSVLVWSCLGLAAAAYLVCILGVLLILRPIWYDIGIFVSSATGMRPTVLPPLMWATAGIALLFAIWPVKIARDEAVRGKADYPLWLKILLVTVLAVWSGLLAVLLRMTGATMVRPGVRYLLDTAAPWAFLVALALCIILGLRIIIPGRINSLARHAMAAALVIAAIILLVGTGRSFMERIGVHPHSVAVRKEPVDFVNPLIGTRGSFEYGKTLPLVAVPFGMTHWTPVTQESAIGVHPYKYHYGDKIAGFLATRKPAIWMGDYGQMMLMPGNGSVKPAFKDRGLFFRHRNEYSTPYYYAVELDCGAVNLIFAEMTATERCGHLRFTFPETENPHIIIEASRHPHFGGAVYVDPERGEISGYNTDRDDDAISPKLPNFKGCFVIQFSRPFVESGTWAGSALFPGERERSGVKVGAYAVFKMRGGETVEARVGTSFISIEQARENLKREIADNPFARTKELAKEQWRRRLDVLRIEDASKDDREVFYTGLYRCFLFPRIFSEYGRYYSAFDDRVHEGTSYNDYSLWDTFRALHPLLLFIAPDRVPGMITSLLQMYREGGWMPKWPNPTYTNIMIGTHADSVIADAWVKGVRGFDAELAYRAMYKNAMTPPDNDDKRKWGDREPWQGYEARGGLTWYKKLGYIPSEKVVESVACTLEYAYDDFCVARMAKALGKEADYQLFRERSVWYKNMYNPATGFMAPKLQDGTWDPNPLRGFCEGGPWTYLFCAMQDVPGLVALMGGPEKFIKKLDENFEGGHYVHENEPGHHYAYLYDYAGAPWKTQEKVREFCLTKYGTGPEGLAGDEDCGQMSAWYVFSAMGFYPVTPGSDEYAIGSPLFPKVTLRPDPAHPERTFEIIAINVSRKNKYIQSATLNGKPLAHPFIKHGDIVGGGSLVFMMGAAPNYGWK